MSKPEYNALSDEKTEAPELIGDYFHIHTVDEIIASSDEPPPCVIDGMLCEQGVMTRSGRAKRGKSWDALQLDITAATGGLWHGRQCGKWDGKKWKPVPTVYINLELPEQTLMFRAKKIAKAMGIKDYRELDTWFTPVTLDCGGLMMAQIQAKFADDQFRGMFTHLMMEQIVRAVDKLNVQPGIISIDSFYKLVGGLNENAVEDVTLIYRHIHKLTKDLGTAVDLIHHHAKGDPSNKMQGQLAAGSRAHAQEPNTVVEMTPHAEENGVCVHVEQRDYKAIPDYCLRWNFPLMDIDLDLDPANVKRAGTGKQSIDSDYSINHVMSVIDNPMTTKDWLAAVRLETNMSESTFYRLRKKALLSGKVVQHGNVFKPAKSRLSASERGVLS